MLYTTGFGSIRVAKAAGEMGWEGGTGNASDRTHKDLLCYSGLYKGFMGMFSVNRDLFVAFFPSLAVYPYVLPGP